MNTLSTRLTKLSPTLLRTNVVQTISTCLPYSSETKEEIVIPKRIPRGPTDILRALESTIKQDPTAAHYKYHDDPFFIPMSNLSKRSFAMARESGRKAAQWIRQEHADLFQHKEAEPAIELFIPKVIYNENSEVTEEDLIKVIKNVHVTDAILIYKLLKQKNLSVSLETQQNLLELLCFYNHEEPIPADLIEERWFRQTSKGKERQRKTWKEGMLSEVIFITIDNPNEEAYSAIIQGMIKFGQIDRAWQLFEEAQRKNLLVSTDTFNSIIGAGNFLKESYELRWTFVMDLLSYMSNAKLKPNLGTLNSVLKILSTMGTGRTVKQNALKILAEFKKMGIAPSLGSWYYMLMIHCKERGPVNPILHDIMNELENNEFQIRDLRDTYFFVTAMDICRHHLKDKDLAKRVDKLLHFGNNYVLIGDSFKESIYYRHYISLLCSMEPIDEFMENVYQRLVPHIYIPEPSVMLDILRSIEANGSIEYLPKFWSDIIIFDQTDRENLITLILNIMVSNEPKENNTLTENFSNIAWDIWNRINNQNENRTQKLQFTGEILGNIMMLLLRNGDFEKACTIMNKLDKSQDKIVGVPNFEALSLFVDHCIKEKAPTTAISCIQYAVDCGYQDVSSLVVALTKSLTLDENHLSKLSTLVGVDVLQSSLQ